MGRHQLILDLTRADVREYVIGFLTDILSSANIEYVKWDMNRNMIDVYSVSLPSDRQGEFYHRYIFGLYEILETVTSSFPDVLFEGCSGGGGRNDPGMLYYMPRNWASDDTDATERLYIQYGGSMVYPASTVGSHVSAVPNHPVGRISSLKTRGTAAMNGAFGYELDLSIEALVYYVVKTARPSNETVYLKLQGLNLTAKYNVEGKIMSGRTLMKHGIIIDDAEHDGNGRIIKHIRLSGSTVDEIVIFDAENDGNSNADTSKLVRYRAMNPDTKYYVSSSSVKSTDSSSGATMYSIKTETPLFVIPKDRTDIVIYQ